MNNASFENARMKIPIQVLSKPFSFRCHDQKRKKRNKYTLSHIYTQLQLDEKWRTTKRIYRLIWCYTYSLKKTFLEKMELLKF